MPAISPDAADAFTQRDPNEKPERMLTELMTGVPKELSTAITNEADSLAWDALAADLARMKGKRIEYDLPMTEEP